MWSPSPGSMLARAARKVLEPPRFSQSSWSQAVSHTPTRTHPRTHTPAHALTHARTHSQNTPARTSARRHAGKQARKQTHTHTHTHTFKREHPDAHAHTHTHHKFSCTTLRYATHTTLHCAKLLFTTHRTTTPHFATLDRACAHTHSSTSGKLTTYPSKQTLTRISKDSHTHTPHPGAGAVPGCIVEPTRNGNPHCEPSARAVQKRGSPLARPFAFRVGFRPTRAGALNS